MKIFNIIKKTIVVLSFVLFGAAFVIGGITLNSTDIAFSTSLLAFVVVAFVGFFLFFSKNATAQKIGLGLTTAGMLVVLFLALSAIDKASAAAILGLVSVILYVLYFIVALIGRLALGGEDSNDPETDPKVKKILGWKKLLDDGVISSEEYETKRQAILGLKNDSKKK